MLLISLYSALYIVDQAELAILVQLGKPVGTTIGPGLHIKIPFIQKAIFFDNRLLDYGALPAEILSADKKSLKVDYYAKWKIVAPLTFYETMRNIDGALLCLNSTIDSEIRMELGRLMMIDIISKPRTEILNAVRKRSDARVENYGINIIDIRIKRIDLPQENRQAVYARMMAERDRQAQKYRAEGLGEAVKIKAAAEHDRTVILSEARRKAQMIRGQGEAEATRIYAEAFGQDPEYFNLMRTLEASRKALDANTIFIMSQDYELLRFMKKSGASFGQD